MAIEYIGTPDIKVFPSAFRNGDEEAKRTTEENLIKFNRLSSSANNLDQMFEDPDDSDYVIFNIHGYWFRCLKTSIPLGTLGTNLFAYIKLEKVAGVGWKLSAIPESALDDEDSKFTGLGFDTTVPEDVKEEGELTVKYYGLKVKDENGEIVEQKLKLTSDEIRNKNTYRSIREELITTSIMAEEINAEEINANKISVTGNITATGAVQSGSITTGNITAAKINGVALKSTLSQTYSGAEINVSGCCAQFLQVTNDFNNTLSKIIITGQDVSSEIIAPLAGRISLPANSSDYGNARLWIQDWPDGGDIPHNSWVLPKDLATGVYYLTTPPLTANTYGLHIVLLDSTVNPPASVTKYDGYIYMWY